MICKFLLFVQLILLIFLIQIASCNPTCGDYGQPPCKFVPAAPGSTPPCAGVGKTFCENIDSYPTDLVKKLLKNYKLEEVLANEKKTEFDELTHEDPNNAYKDMNMDDLKNKQLNYNYNWLDSSSVKPQQSYRAQWLQQLLFYPNQQQQFTSTGGYYYPHPNTQTTNQKFQQTFIYQENIHGLLPPPKSSRFSFSNNKKSKFNRSKKRVKRDEFLNFIHRNPKDNSPLREQLCKTVSKFIEPKAAESTSGYWRWIIYEPEEFKVTQNVKTEICTSSTCASDLCQLPNNYNSRCEQKFTQKRLLAVYPSGERLYTDTFWFPSCCVCTFSNM